MKKYFTKINVAVLSVLTYLTISSPVAFAAEVDGQRNRGVINTINKNNGLANFNIAINYFLLFIITIAVLSAFAAFYIGSYKVSKAIQKGADQEVVTHFKSLSTMFWNTVIATGSLTLLGIIAKLCLLTQGYGIS